MKKSELKEMIKPIVQECIQESVQQILLESGLLSSVISEVVKGLDRPAMVTESKVTPPPQKRPAPKQDKEISNKLVETREKLMSAIGKDSYGGVNVFEGIKPALADTGANGNPLKDTDPSDSGVDISSIANANWSKLI